MLFLLCGPFTGLVGSPNDHNQVAAAAASGNTLSSGHALTSISSFNSASQNSTKNSLVSNCVSPFGNSEVESTVDPTNGYIYEEWIGCNGIGFARSTDGGLKFSAAITLLGSNDYGGNSSWDPAIVVSGSGVIYASFMLSEQGTGGVPYVAISYDHGQSFAKSVNISTPSNTEFSDRDFIAVSKNNTVYVTWNYAPNASLVKTYCAPGGSCYYTSGDLNIVISRSTDGGLTWSSPVPISPNFPNGGGVSAPLLVEPNGQIDVLYEDYNIGMDHTLEQGYNYFTYSTDGGRTWANRTIVGSGGGRYLSNTEWWIDGDLSRDSSGTLYASFDTPNGTQEEDAWLTYSSNDGRTWSNPIELNKGINSAYNIMPGVLGTANSSVYVAWLGENSSGWNTYFQVFSNNGLPLYRPLVVSDLIGIKGIWGGDTLGIAGLDNGVSICWGYGISNFGKNESEIFASTLYDVALTAQGSGTVNPSGSNWYVDNSTILISANPSSSSSFSGWVATSPSLMIENASSKNTLVNILGGGSISANFQALSSSNNSTESQVSGTSSLSQSTAHFPYNEYDIALIVIGVVIVAVSALTMARRYRR